MPSELWWYRWAEVSHLRDYRQREVFVDCPLDIFPRKCRIPFRGDRFYDETKRVAAQFSCRYHFSSLAITESDCTTVMRVDTLSECPYLLLQVLDARSTIAYGALGGVFRCAEYWREFSLDCFSAVRQQLVGHALDSLEGPLVSAKRP